MSGLYFRIRPAGALVFRTAENPRTRRLDLVLVARVNLAKGLVRPQPGATLEAEETAAIAAWIEARRAVLAARDADRATRLAEEMNAVADWLASAPPEAVEAAAEPLLMAMHDLRAVLVRRRTEGPPPEG